KFYPKAKKSSLLYYLRECNLDNKVDLPIHCMNKYYERTLKETNTTTAKQMREGGCKYSIYIIIRYALFAIGMKVHNLLSASAWQEEILTSTIPCEQTETEKYPGAYVFLLVKSLKNKQPVTERAESLKKSSKRLHEINFKYNALAGRVTSAGQRNIKLIADLVRSKRFSVKYGDTDSLYLSRMVNISMQVIERLRDKVNDFLRNDNGSSYLKIAYEEVLFPVIFTEKKKYYGIPHRREPNFNNKLFIQRVEIVKRRQSKHFREVCKKVMNESMKVDNSRTLHQIVKDMLKEIINDISQIDLNGMIKTAVWKPDKNNKSV
ncbi:17389_t:CDS:2, partial [Funneliformis geosporum]